MKKRFIPAPIDEKHVSLDFLNGVFDRVELADETNREKFKGEWFRVSYPSPDKNVIAFTPENMNGCHWWELYLLFNEMFEENCDDNLFVSVDYSDTTGAVFLKFYMCSEE